MMDEDFLTETNERRSKLGSALPYDLRSLRYVLAAAEHLSLHAAADALDLDRTTVSRAVRDFEDRVGVGLFERGQFGVRLTDAGEQLLDGIIPALVQIEHAVQFAAAAGRVENGTVRIGIISTLAGGFLRKLVHSYEREHPGIKLAILDGGRREHLRAIRARKLDVAFLTAVDDASGCDVSELWRERVYVAMPASHTLADLEGLDWPDLRDEVVIVSRTASGPDVHDYIVRRSAGQRSYPTVEYCEAGQETLMHMVAIGRGITLVAEAWREMPVPGLALVPLIADDDIVPFSAVWSPANDNPSLRRFVSFAQKRRRRPTTV
jgi:DNA-binding transcriptional LysR family regulator